MLARMRPLSKSLSCYSLCVVEETEPPLRGDGPASRGHENVRVGELVAMHYFLGPGCSDIGVIGCFLKKFLQSDIDMILFIVRKHWSW